MTSRFRAPWWYRALVVLLSPFVLARVWWRGRTEPVYRRHWWQRLGWYGGEVSNPPGLLWIHAVSLGEARAAGVLIEAIRQRWPAQRLLLTHSTATGWSEGCRWVRDGDVQAWLPWDSPGACRRFLRHFRPGVGLLIETEVWPNLIMAAREAQLPLWLVNARLSERTLRKARQWSALSDAAYAGLASVWAQTEADACRLRALHAPVAGIMGNLKFDAKPSVDLLEQGRRWRIRFDDDRPIVIVASSREGEEALWLRALRDEPAARRIRWLLVPRHPQRFTEVEQLLVSAGLLVSRRSAWSDDEGQRDGKCPRQADVLLGDSIGEMAAYYAMADWALLGGSFLPYGGQNLIEAIACGCPVLVGPHVFNFQDAADAASGAGLAVRVADIPDAVRMSLRWCDDPSIPAGLRERAPAWLAFHRGAVDRLLEALEAARLLPVSASG